MQPLALILEHFHHPQKRLQLYLLPVLWPPLTTFCLCGLACSGHGISRESYNGFCIWLLSVSVIFSRFTHAVMPVSTPLLFTSEQNSTVWVKYILFTHSAMGWYLGHFHYLLFMDIAAVSIPVQISVLRVFSSLLGLLVHIPSSSAVKNPSAVPQTQETRMHLWDGEIPWRRKWQLTPVFLPGELHGQRSLAGYSPWYCKESDTTEWLNTHTHTYQGMLPHHS